MEAINKEQLHRFDGLYNFRDIGGLEIEDGRKYLCEACEINEKTIADLKELLIE